MSRELCVILKLGSVTISVTLKHQNVLAEVKHRYVTGMHKVCSAYD